MVEKRSFDIQVADWEMRKCQFSETSSRLFIQKRRKRKLRVNLALAQLLSQPSPGDGSKTHAGLAYSEIGDKTVQMMEVRRDEEQVAFVRALDNGWHIAPEGSDDTYSPNWGNVRSWTGILAPGLSKQNVLDALAKRHVYSTLDRNCKLTFQINGATMGDVIEEPANEVRVKVLVDDGDEGDVTAKIELFEDGNVVQMSEPNKQATCWLAGCSPSAGKHYYVVKVTQADGKQERSGGFMRPRGNGGLTGGFINPV